MEDEINQLCEMLAQLPPDCQRRVIRELIETVKWFLEIEGAPREGDMYTSSTDEGVMHTTSYSFGRSRSHGISISRPSKIILPDERS